VLPRIDLIAPVSIAAPLDHPDWIFELKHDGYRAAAYIENGACELVSRKGNVYKSFAGLCAALGRLRAQDIIVDGEIVCLDGNGRSQFLDLMRRRRAEAVFYAFDLMWHDGEDLRPLPLTERKNRLRTFIRSSQNPAVLIADHIVGNGVKLFAAIRKRDCEGIIAKHRLAPYVTSPATWFKVLNPDYTQKRGRREMFDRFHLLRVR
jgi:bifunctional non-homologous end joining protein LigD